MKKMLYTVLGSCLLAACTPSQSFEISGTLSGIESDTLIVYSRALPYSQEAGVQTDTIALQGGKFAFNVGDTVLKQVNILAKPSSKPNADGSVSAASVKFISLLLLPEKPVTITGSMDDYTLSGDAFYEDVTTVNRTIADTYMSKLDSLTNVCMEMERAGISGDSIRKVYAPAREWINEMMDRTADYIKQNSDKEISVWLLFQVSQECRDTLVNVISEPVKTGVMAPLYNEVKKACDDEKNRREAKEKIKEGNPAPEFTLKDLNGQDFNLSSLKGKYVVLDFWGSWCGWCIKGIPEMKKAYEKYKNKLEIVGIDCNDPEKKWKDAVAKYELPWINVYNAGDPDVALMYGISGFPTKIILGKDGKILKVVVGEDPEFYKYLDKLMK